MTPGRFAALLSYVGTLRVQNRRDALARVAAAVAGLGLAGRAEPAAGGNAAKRRKRKRKRNRRRRERLCRAICGGSCTACRAKCANTSNCEGCEFCLHQTNGTNFCNRSLDTDGCSACASSADCPSGFPFCVTGYTDRASGATSLIPGCATTAGVCVNKSVCI